MGKPPKKKTTNGFGTHLTRLPRWLRIGVLWGTAIGVITGAVVSADKSTPIVEPFVPAHRGYVRDQIDGLNIRFKVSEDGTQSILRDLQIEQAEGKRDAAKEAKAKWGIELGKTADPVTKDMIERHINELDGSVNKLEGQIRTLNLLRAQQH